MQLPVACSYRQYENEKLLNLVTTFENGGGNVLILLWLRTTFIGGKMISKVTIRHDRQQRLLLNLSLF